MKMQIHPLSQLDRMFLEVFQVCVFDCIKEKESLGVKLEQTIQAVKVLRNHFHGFI